MIVASGFLPPSSISREYRVRVVYAQGRYPESFIDDPPLTRRPEEPAVPIPHTYDANQQGKGRPCLFHPSSVELVGSPLADERRAHRNLRRRDGNFRGGETFL